MVIPKKVAAGAWLAESRRLYMSVLGGATVPPFAVSFPTKE
jgi:hypothetical protein